MKKLFQIIEKRFKIIAIFLLALILIVFFDKVLAVGLISLAILMMATFWVLKKLRLSNKHLIILLLITLIIHLIAVLFIYYADFKPVGIGKGDSGSYHIMATRISNSFKQGDFSIGGLIKGHYYPAVIGVIYTLTLSEMLIAQLFGVWLSVLTILFVYLIVLELGSSKKWGFLIGLIASVYPSFLFYGSLILKDTLVIPFTLLTILLTLKLIKSFSWRNFFFFVIALSIMFHFRFYLAYALLFAFLISWLLLARLRPIRKKIVYSVIIIVILGFLPVALKDHGFYGIDILKSNLSTEEIISYQKRVYNPRELPKPAEFLESPSPSKNSPLTNTFQGGYASTWDKEEVSFMENSLRFSINQLKYFGYTLLGPLPWQMRYSHHLFALFEIIPWYILLFFVGKGIWESIKSRNKLILPLILFSILTLGAMSLFFNNFGIITRIRIPVFITLLCLIPLGFRNRVPSLTAVGIEINSACNRRCDWCPNHTNRREVKFLEEKVFFKVIDELREMNFKGRITYNLYNEPLLDERLPRFIEYVKKNLPSSQSYLNTNGDLLNLDIWQKLRRAGLDYANISQYDGKINENIEKILRVIDSKEKKHFQAHIFDLNSICNRAGLLKSKEELKLPLKKRCHRPSYQLFVNYKGKVVLCCNDYHSAVEMGDVTLNSIEEIWENEKFQHYREELQKGNRANLKLCNVCDM